MKLAEERPCFEAFSEQQALTQSLVGPVDLAALASVGGRRLLGDAWEREVI